MDKTPRDKIPKTMLTEFGGSPKTETSGGENPMKNEEGKPYELTMQFDGHPDEVLYEMNPQRLMYRLFQRFESFDDDLIPVHSEYNQAGQLCYWELNYAGEFPKDLYPQIEGEKVLTRAVIRKTVRNPVETYPLATSVAVPNRQYVWARIEDGVVTDWREFKSAPNQEVAKSLRGAMLRELGDNNARVKSGLVKGRTLHITKVPAHLRGF